MLMAMHLGRLLFPDPPRDLPGRRILKVSLRACHVLCVALFVGAVFFDIAADTQSTWRTATIGTGMILLVLDLHESAVFLLQTRGLLVITKITSVALLPAFGTWGRWILLVLLVVSVVSSHAPSRVRYFLIWGRGRLRPTDSKG